MKAYKGFDKDLKCRGFQYEVGKEYTEDEAVLCEKGFHACLRPIDVFPYYAPGNGSRYCAVEIDDVVEKTYDSDSKVCGKRIRIVEEIGIRGLVKAQADYDNARANADGNKPVATAGYRGTATAGLQGVAIAGDYGAATAGECGAATAGGYGAATAGECGAATAGECGVAIAGDYGAATAGLQGVAIAGDYGAATAGDYGAATARNYGAATAGNRGTATSRGSAEVGKYGVASATGYRAKVKGGFGALLVFAVTPHLCDDVVSWSAGVVDGKTLKPDTWYTSVDGKFTEVT